MRILVFLFFIVDTIFASEFYEAKILKSNPSLNFENIRSNKEFKDVSLPLMYQKDSNSYWIKLKINKSKLYDKQKLLVLSSLFELNIIQMEKIQESKMTYKNTIELNQNTPQYIYLKIINNNNLINISIDIYDKKKFIEQKLLRKTLYGIAMGIPITAFLYYLFFYIFNRKKSFLYYSLTQLSAAFILIFTEDQDHILCDTISASFGIFAILFTQSFLDTKKYIPIMHKILNISILLYALDSFLPLSDIIPIPLLMILFPISGILIYNKTKQKQIIFYILGWSILVATFVFIIIELIFTSVIPSNINYEDILHITIPLESVILAFALSYMIKLNEDEKNQKEKLLIHQNKLASIGEMINNIAHQWRQPLTHLGYIFMNINKAHSLDRLDKSYLKKKSKEARDQLEHMSMTIDVFKDFYTPRNTKTDISVKEELADTLLILSSSLTKEGISIDVKGEEFFINGYRGELSQVFLNIISNARDALKNNNTKSPNIIVFFEKNKIKIQDNAGGIPSNLKEDIFSAYFTTKKQGSGIGLYMSRIIIEKHFLGSLIHENIDDGSMFTINLNL